jgi:D-alanine-D-alanine ligase
MTEGSRRVAVLKGGSSLERAVSLRSGAQVEDALQGLGHAVSGIDVGADLVERLLDESPDAVFVALHGPQGEDGTVQALMGALGLPYTGSGPAACLRGTDKALAKHLMREAGIPTPDFQELHQSAIRDLGAGAALPKIESQLGFPLVVKPSRGGSALGVKFASSSEELPGAMVGAFSYDGTILLERHVRGRDLAVSVLGPARPSARPSARPFTRPAGQAGGGERARALPIVEAVPRQVEFYDYESRYGIGMTTFVCPAALPEEITVRAQEMAVAVYELLGCHGFARIDLMADNETDELWVLEANVVPGMTETSLLPQAADAAGISFDELVGQMLESAFTR